MQFNSAIAFSNRIAIPKQMGILKTANFYPTSWGGGLKFVDDKTIINSKMS